jgi:hypothetical protein
VREVPHFSQADFYEDDVMILDCYNEVSGSSVRALGFSAFVEEYFGVDLRRAGVCLVWLWQQ